jgi:hypothetical protein
MTGNASPIDILFIIGILSRVSDQKKDGRALELAHQLIQVNCRRMN